MGRVLAWLMIITGSVILAFNGYKWWGELNIAVRDPKIAIKISDDWQKTKQEPALTSIDNLSNADEEFQPGENEELEQMSNNETQNTDNEPQETEKSKTESNNTNNSSQQQKPTQTNHKPKKKSTNLRVGSQIGQLIIPKIGAYKPIVEGTDDKSLEKGIGKFRGWGTVAPNENGHVVLSGHRDTHLTKAGKLVNGDKIYVKYRNKIYTYQIRKTWVTHADDRTVIVPIDRPVLSLTTCYPFDFKGDAPDRYIIRADLIKIQNG